MVNPLAMEIVEGGGREQEGRVEPKERAGGGGNM